ncbi:MAG TPA: hypothetical protein VJN66_06330, partial [Rhodanobacteraceae bacterium]|nr:hypothetical protein [Rhodanobacteraceae bacterium]
MLMLAVIRWSATLPLAIALCGCQLGVTNAAGSTPTKDETAAQAIPDGCKPLAQSKGQIPVMAIVARTGRYCLVQDLVQRNMYDLVEGRNRGSPRSDGVVGVMLAKNVDIDLGGHL